MGDAVADNKKIFMNKIVALVGMPGTGKSVVTDYFEKKGYHKIYFGGVTVEEVKRRGIPLNEANEKMVREEFREKYGMQAYATLNLPKIEESLGGGNVIIDGLYSWSEYKVLSDKFGERMNVLAIVSPRKARYERLAKRPVRPLTYEETKSRDYSEIEKLEKGGPIAIADYTVLNDGTIEDLLKKMEETIY